MTTDPHAIDPTEVQPARAELGPTMAPPAQDDWREHVARWYYDSSPALLGGFGDLYVVEPRDATKEAS